MAGRPDLLADKARVRRFSEEGLGRGKLDLIAEGDRVAAFLRLSGTNTGAYRRGGATNRQASMRAFFICALPMAVWSRDGELAANR